MLLGETGTGKTLFAEIMYRYAIEVGRLSEESPFIIFNCADYAGNPQLLLSHLFGYVKELLPVPIKIKRLDRQCGRRDFIFR